MPIILPNTGKRTSLPIQLIDPLALLPEDEEMLVAMQEHPPISDFTQGDLVRIKEVPLYLKRTRQHLPNIWQVRFVISTWQHEIMRLVQSTRVHGIDHAHSLLDEAGLCETRWNKPVIYAHGFPHGMYPDSAAWFMERMLRKINFREMNQDWHMILDEAKAPFIGYDDSTLMVPYTFDMAPDLYSTGENLGKPFSFEEATVHTAALLGMETDMFCPTAANAPRPLEMCSRWGKCFYPECQDRFGGNSDMCQIRRR